MFRGCRRYRPSCRGFPRVRGDVPVRPVACGNSPLFSPRARGCSCRQGRRHAGAAVFPACAGMFLTCPLCEWRAISFPRVRGDVPCSVVCNRPRGGFSPRARGCSAATGAASESAMVFPACAGMFPHPAKRGGRRSGFPRVRGDVPHPSPCRYRG